MDDRHFDRRTLVALIAVLAAGAMLLKDAPPVHASATVAVADARPASEITAYETARDQGSPIELCARAGAVATAYRADHDESMASRWQEIQDVHCNEARFWQDRTNAEGLAVSAVTVETPAAPATANP